MYTCSIRCLLYDALSVCEFGCCVQPAAAKQYHQPGGRFGGVGHDGDIAVTGRKGLARRIELARIARGPDRRVERRVAQMLDQHERGEAFEHRHLNLLPLPGSEL